MIFSFLGKFAQRSNLTKTKRVTEPKDLFAYLDSDKYEVKDAQMINDETIEIQCTEKEGFIEENDKVNIVIAAFTTAYARLKLYDLLDLLQERVLYYDTDSVVYIHQPGKPDPPLGKHLGSSPTNWSLAITSRRFFRVVQRIMPTKQTTARQYSKYEASR